MAGAIESAPVLLEWVGSEHEKLYHLHNLPRYHHFQNWNPMLWLKACIWINAFLDFPICNLGLMGDNSNLLLELLLLAEQPLLLPQLSSEVHRSSWQQWPRSSWQDRRSQGRWWEGRRWYAMDPLFSRRPGRGPPSNLESSDEKHKESSNQKYQSLCNHCQDSPQILQGICSSLVMDRLHWNFHKADNSLHPPSYTSWICLSWKRTKFHRWVHPRNCRWESSWCTYWSTHPCRFEAPEEQTQKEQKQLKL